MTEPSSKAMDRLAEAITAGREVTDRRLEALAATVERTSQNVDRTLERKFPRDAGNFLM